VVIAMQSSGLHSNGFSLVRHVLLQGARMRLEAHVDELGGPLGECLLTPTRIYALDCLSLIAETEVHGFSHVTGAGWPRTSPGCCRRTCPPRSTAAPGARSRSSTWCGRGVAVRRGGDGAALQPGGRHGRPRGPVRRRPGAGPADRPARAVLVAGQVQAGDGTVTLPGSYAA
jgi:hypothetical protein